MNRPTKMFKEDKINNRIELRFISHGLEGRWMSGASLWPPGNWQMERFFLLSVESWQVYLVL